MKNLIKKSAIAAAVSLLMGSSAVWAADPAEDPTASTITTNNNTDVSLKKDVSVTKNYAQAGEVKIKGEIAVDSASASTVDDKQLNYGNSVNSVEDSSDPTFTANTGAISNNAGNVGVNSAAGVNNQQDNAAAISTSTSPIANAAGDLSFVLGSTDAEVFVHQSVYGNDTNLIGAQLDANTGVIDSNAGNLGVNVTAGVSNLQKNNLAISNGDSGLAEASSATLQETTGITTTIADHTGDVFGNGAVATNYTAAVGDVTNNAGNIGVNVASGSNNLQANSLAISAVNP